MQKRIIFAGGNKLYRVSNFDQTIFIVFFKMKLLILSFLK